MTGKELWKLKEGDLLKFDRKSGWPASVWQVEFLEHYAGIFNIYLRNTAKKETPNVFPVTVKDLLNYAQIVSEDTEDTKNVHKNVIEHKFDIRDEAWVMFCDKPHKVHIINFTATFKHAKPYTLVYEVVYDGVNEDPHKTTYMESEIFATKDELLDSLR